MSRRLRVSALGENLVMALQNLRGNKGRSALVILGVALGVTTLMAEVSIIQGFKGRLESEILNTDITQIYLTRNDPFGETEDWARRPRLTEEDGEAIAELPSVRLVDPRASTGTVARHAGEKASLMNVIGAGLNYQEVENDFLEAGRFFTAVEYSGARDVCVIGRQPADDLFGGRDPIGRKIRVDENKELTVVGIFAKRESIFGSLAQNYLVLPLTTLRKNFPWADEIVIVAVPEGNDQMKRAEEDIELLMRIRHRLSPGADNDFNVSTQNMAVDFTRQVTGPLTLVGVVLASIGLMVGGIGVITIMLVSVQERTREIGVRMAVGGTRRDILQLFLVEAATLTGAGGLVGVLAGLAIGWILHLTLHLPASVPVPYIVGALLVSAGTGIFFGLYPAVKASRLDPIESLRYE
ncbi:MAG: ABC transporter permease [Candidatus Latescibacteria bacterium]|nr:ABC transporter permease [Candidatus Latescibacterota bacterium]MCB9515863.1 ABC transporter permease [Candidatus Latescibacterota bacterium]